jgi:replication factor C large subunit
MDWAEKFRPQHLRDMIGNETALRQMADWARDWNRQKKPLILYGKPGIGKTSGAHALAGDMGWEVIELNASDQRTKAVIDRVAGGGSTTGSLTGAKKKMVLLDEADNLHGTADRGGARAIIDIIRESRQPIILVANDLYNISPDLRQLCEPVHFKAAQVRSIVPRLRHICSAEGVTCSDAAIRDIAESSGGDIRSAVNMLYASAIGRDTLDEEDVHTSQKDKRATIFELITAVFGKADAAGLMEIAREVEDDPEAVGQWIEGNVSHLQARDAIALAYRCLARSDEYLGYTYRRQYYLLWRYASALALIGVSRAAGGKGIHARIMPPERWQRMGRSRKQKASRTALLRKLAGMMHVPMATVRDGYLGMISLLAAADPDTYAEALSLDADQLAILIRNRERANQVIKSIALARKKREKEMKPETVPMDAEAGPDVQKNEGDTRKSPAPGMQPEPEKNSKEIPADTTPPESSEERKGPARTQSTLFDEF